MKTFSIFVSLFFAAACQSDDGDKSPVGGTGTIEVLVDADGDGVIEEADCDDSDATVHPGAPEQCNEIDDDCDGVVDEDPADGAVFYYDGDGDGHGIDAVSVSACSAPESYATGAGDCDDSDPAIHPDAAEDDCTDPVDYNCDGSVGYADMDGDGSPACEDCNDSNAEVSPDMVEVCNDGVDDDCDGAADGPGALGESTWYADTDGDLHGDPGVSVESCEEPDGYVDNSTDCNDEAASANPSGVEFCDGLDNDCDGEVDGAGAIGGMTLYPDEDGDGYGLESSSVLGCESMEGYVSTPGDCDDTTAAVYPGADEVCDGLDNDCSGSVDEGLLSVVYADPDGDGFGLTLVSMESCGVPEGYATLSGDCDEADADIHPGAEEVCDGADNDCSGSVDEGLLSTVYADPDGDGYGLALLPMDGCGVPDGYAAMAGDCDETDGAIHPGAEEVCDGEDNDCSGGVDEGLSEVFYADTDGDGFGVEASAMEACSIPFGHTTVVGDCAPDDGDIHPDATEICDAVDNNCNDLVDDDDDGLDLTTATLFYPDLDLDGYGAGVAEMSCLEPDGHVLDDTDCLDSDGASYPGAAEVWYDGVDQDCAGGSDYDADGDGVDSADHGGLDVDDLDPSCTTVCSVGLTPATAATTCEDILDASPSAANGTYWIDMGMGTPLETFCDMDGGGWTSCFELVNTTDEDLVGNDWFDRCVDWTMSGNTENQFRITVQDSSGVDQYDAVGTRPGTWTYNQITSAAGADNQYHSDHHSRIPLDTGHSLFVSGRSGTQSGCGGSLGNGYALVVYGPGGDYHNELKLLLASYYQVSGYEGVRGFSPWSESHELSMATSGTFSSCTATPDMLGTFRFFVR
jgi:hypothetical protein